MRFIFSFVIWSDLFCKIELNFYPISFVDNKSSITDILNIMPSQVLLVNQKTITHNDELISAAFDYVDLQLEHRFLQYWVFGCSNEKDISTN